MDVDPTRPAPVLVENTYDGKIEFNFASIGGKDCKTLEDEYQLMMATPELYCLRACHKIGFYLQRMHRVDLMRMEVEFYQDDNGKVWFSHASEIYTRKLEFVQSYLNLLIPTFLGTEGEKDEKVALRGLKEGVKEPLKVSGKEDADIMDIIYRTRTSQNKGISISELKRQTSQMIR